MMSTLVTKVVVSETTQRFKRNLLSAQASFDVGNKLSAIKVSLTQGNETVQNFTTICIAYFSKPTLIQLTIGGSTTSFQVDGLFVLPTAGSIRVAHPGAGTTDPTEVEFLIS